MDFVFQHNLTVAFTAGTLHLVSPWGPVLWNHALFADALDDPTPVVLRKEGSRCPRGKVGVAGLRREATLSALHRLAEQAAGGEPPACQSPAHLTAVAGFWERIALMPYKLLDQRGAFSGYGRTGTRRPRKTRQSP